MKKTALIFGSTGQDGSYLAELLLEKGYDVHGMIRRSSSFNTGRINHIFDDLTLHYGDMTDGSSIFSLINSIRPDEIYNLAAQSHVKVSFEIPEYTALTDGLGTLKMLDAVRFIDGYHPRIYNACTSEMYGSATAPQNEDTPFMPCSPYGTAKLYSYWICRNYRESYGMHVSNGILFNHESPRRGGTFVTQKVVQGAVAIAKKRQGHITLGNLNARRDWGHAKDYVDAMWLMTQMEKSDDYVIATGVSYSVKDLVEYVFQYLGMSLKWEHNNTIGICGDRIVVYAQREKYIRPNEVNDLRGDSTKARTVLGWTPKYTFHGMIDDMIKAELDNG